MSEAIQFEAPEAWTADAVEERMIEAIISRDRMTPSGRKVMATDGPWHKIIRDYDAFLGPNADYKPETLAELIERLARKRGALNSAEYDRMIEAENWVTFIAPRRRLRPLVGIVLQYKAANGSRVDWAMVKRRGRFDDDANTLRMSFKRSMEGIARTLNRKHIPVSL
jgi:hypothetical protein